MTSGVDISKRKNWVPIFPPGVLKKRQRSEDGGPDIPLPPPPSPEVDYSMSESPPQRNLADRIGAGAPPRMNLADRIGAGAPPRMNLADRFGERDTSTFSVHHDASEDEPQGENADDVPAHDFFFEAEKVLSLNSSNFNSFLTRKDATMVMFYNDKFPDSHIFQSVFSEAARNTKRENSAFASVDCGANPKLCIANGALKIPLMRLYSKNYCIGEFKTVKGLTADFLRQFVEMAPLSDSSHMVACSRNTKKTC